MNTTHGEIDDAQLARTVGLEDRPALMAVWVEWRLGDEVVRREAYPLPKELGPLVHTTLGDVPIGDLVRTVELTDAPGDIAVAVTYRINGELVRRDAHVILKQASVVATALAATI